MTHEQICETDLALESLKEARKHLDNAMYNLGEMSDVEKGRLRILYDLICKVQDVAANPDSAVSVTNENNHKSNIQIWLM